MVTSKELGQEGLFLAFPPQRAGQLSHGVTTCVSLCSPGVDDQGPIHPVQPLLLAQRSIELMLAWALHASLSD